MKDKNCIFCKIARKEMHAQFISETDNFIAILDANPRSEGHALIIPKKHYVTLLDIPNTLAKEMLELIKKVCLDILEKKQGDGFNIVMNNLSPAGQVVMHAHVHIVPRKEKDGLRALA